MDPITILPREIIQYIGLLDLEVAFKYRQLNKKYRELSNNEYWHIILGDRYFKEKFNSESNYCGRVLYLHLHPISLLEEAINGDQVRRLVASGLSLTGISMMKEESFYIDLRETAVQATVSGHPSVTRAILECSDDEGREMLGRKIIFFLKQRITSEVSPEQVDIIKYLALQHSREQSTWKLLEAIPPKLLVGVQFWKELMEKRIGMENISRMPLYLAASNDLESTDLLLRSGIRPDRIPNNTSIPLSLRSIELFRKYGIHLFDDEDIMKFLSGKSYTPISRIIAGCNAEFIESIVQEFNRRDLQGIAKWSNHLFNTIISSSYRNFRSVKAIVDNYPSLISELNFGEYIMSSHGMMKLSDFLSNLDVEILRYILEEGMKNGAVIDHHKLVNILTGPRVTPEVFKYLISTGVGEYLFVDNILFLFRAATVIHRNRILKFSLESGLIDSVLKRNDSRFPPTILIDYINLMQLPSSITEPFLDRYGVIEENPVTEINNIEIICDIIRLLASRVNVNRIEKRWSALLEAVNMESIEVVKVLLSVGANPVMKTPSSDLSPILRAVRIDDKKIFDLLLPYHSGYQVKDKKMKKMIKGKSLRAALQEIASGADPHIDQEIFDIMIDEFTCYDTEEHFFTKLIVWSNPELATDQNISRAIDVGNRSVVSTLLDCGGIVPNGRNRDGTPHYHLALYKLHQETNTQMIEIRTEVQQILGYVLDGTVFDQEGNSSLMVAVNLRSRDLIDITVNNEELYTANNEGLTPMKLAIYNGDIAIIEHLMGKRYDPTREKDIREFSEQYGTKEITDTIFNYIPESDEESSDEY